MLRWKTLHSSSLLNKRKVKAPGAIIPGGRRNSQNPACTSITTLRCLNTSGATLNTFQTDHGFNIAVTYESLLFTEIQYIPHTMNRVTEPGISLLAPAIPLSTSPRGLQQSVLFYLMKTPTCPLQNAPSFHYPPRVSRLIYGPNTPQYTQRLLRLRSHSP